LDSEQILINMYKQKHYNATQHTMQKIIMMVSILACSIGVAVMIIYYIGLLVIYAFAGAVVCAVVVLLLFRLKVVSFNIATYLFMLYICFILIPIFWYFTGVSGSASYVSLIILVTVLSVFSGKMQKRLWLAYLVLLFVLTSYSAVREIPIATNVPQLVYVIAAYTVAVILISYYLLLKNKKIDELNDEFLRSSFKDDLTKAYNRKLLDIIMQYEESLYKQEKSDYILIMFDIDKFKQMNDDHGHVFGDIILRNVALCINDRVRSSDFVVRYGGDEFLVVQTNATEKSIQFFIDRIEEAIDSSCDLGVEVSVSYGFAARSECENFEEVLILADQRLYEKKEALAKKEI